MRGSIADGDPQAMIADATQALQREKAVLRASGRPAAQLPPANYLAVSGGGDNGAFGAGLLNGWTETGTRPQFKMRDRRQHRRADRAASPSSGREYDPALREVYTTMNRRQGLPRARPHRGPVRRRHGRHQRRCRS